MTKTDDFERRMAGVARTAGGDHLDEEAVVGGRRGGVVRERLSGRKRGGGAGSAAGAAGRIGIGSVAGLNRSQARALQAGRIEIGARLDLHGLSRREATGRVAAFLAGSARSGVRCVLVITGQGRPGRLAAARGVLRGQMEGWLNEPRNREHVLACVPAQPRDGGRGAFYVLLRRSRAGTEPERR